MMLSLYTDLTFSIPSFNKTSFISYSTIEDGLMQLSIHLDIKLASLDDGIIMYDAGSEDGTGDFVALVVKDHYLEFRFDTGSGMLIFFRYIAHQDFSTQGVVITSILNTKEINIFQ